MNNTPKKPWTTGEKFLLGVILGVVALGALLGAFLRLRDLPPVVSVPTPRMPAPNAFDFYVAAGNAVTDDKKIGFAASRHPAPGDPVYSLAEKDALVAANAGPLKTLRQGFAYPYLNPPSRSFDALFPYYAKERGLARLLSLEGHTKGVRGDWRGASISYLDAVQMGEEIPHGSVLIGMLVGLACQSIGRRPVWKTVNHLDAKGARAAAGRMERITAHHVPYADTLQEEKWGFQASIMEIFHKPNWRKEFANLMTDDPSYARTRLQAWLMLDFTSKRKMMDDYTEAMDGEIARARQPFAAQGPERDYSKNFVLATFMPIFAQARLKEVDSTTQNALLTATLALRAYKLKQGAYPAKLEALTPGYLKTLPADPFAAAGPLRYRRNGAAYALYSVGPDGKDDGGRAIFNAREPSPQAGSSDRRRFVNADSVGDVVAGVNIY